MKKPHRHEKTPEKLGADQVETLEAVDAAIKFARDSRATWDELLGQTRNGYCRKRQSCTPVKAVK
jgi:hypothetical protein